MEDSTAPISQPNSSDPYRFHRLALAPINTEIEPTWVIDELASIGLPVFFSWLEQNALQQIWRVYLEPLALPPEFEPFIERLCEHARLTAAHQLLQNQALQEIEELNTEKGISGLVFKGADLRSWLYSDPVLRPVSDLDLFVRPDQRQDAIDCLVKDGYQLRVLPENASHEVELTKPRISIDLHWHPFRPGRARPGLNEWLFAHRSGQSALPGLDATASLLIMLVHPAITKYLVAPTSLMIHQVDIARLLDHSEIDEDALISAIDSYGLKTAAWSSLYLLRQLSGIEARNGLEERLKPGKLHAGYISNWIDHDWINRWWRHRWLVAGGFSLALQDSARDRWRAVKLRSAPRWQS